MSDKKESLEKRVEQFQMLELPGQPQMGHMGTIYLVSDLWNEVKKLQKGIGEITEALRKEEEKYDRRE